MGTTARCFHPGRQKCGGPVGTATAPHAAVIRRPPHRVSLEARGEHLPGSNERVLSHLLLKRCKKKPFKRKFKIISSFIILKKSSFQ